MDHFTPRDGETRKPIAVRLPRNVILALDEAVAKTSGTRTDLIEFIIRNHLKMPMGKVPAMIPADRVFGSPVAPAAAELEGTVFG